MNNQEGFSIAAILVALGIAGIVGMLLADISSTSVKVGGQISANREIEDIKIALLERIDCAKTLNTSPYDIRAISPAALKCSDYSSVNLKGRRGNNLANSSGQIGKWKVHAGCQNDEIIVTLSRPGKNPRSGKKWNDMPFATHDLFMGTSDFCREYFDKRYNRLRDYTLQELIAHKTDCGPNGGPGTWQECFGSCQDIIHGDLVQQHIFANTACHRACAKDGWVGGRLVECNGVTNPTPAYHQVTCFCSL